MAFNDAISDMLAGRIDYAVVGGACSILRPQTSLAFQRLQMLSPDVSEAHMHTSPLADTHLAAGLHLTSMPPSCPI